MRMRRIHPLAIWAAAGALFVAGPTLRASETDNRIESSAQMSHMFKTYLKDDTIKTESENGVVTLTGTVAEASHKSLAQDTVESLPGVKSVDNQLKVKGTGPTEHSDMWLALKVKSALLFHRHVSASGTDVFVKDGTVSLRGEASNLAQMELTTEYAQDVEGVLAVKNEMTMAKSAANPVPTIGEKIDDASITAQIKSSLSAHRSTSAIRTKVATRDGVVTVTGPARNSAEISLVTKLVTGIDGVSRVINNMTLEKAVSKTGFAPGPVRNLKIVGN